MKATMLTAGELASRILAGERDFSGTTLGESANLSGLAEYQDLLAYLRGQDLRASPVIAEGADWHGLSAPGLFFQAAKLSGANLSGANLERADLRRAELPGANLSGANLSGATMIVARLMGANLEGAALRGADFYEANPSDGNMRGVNAAGARLIRLNLKGVDVTGAVWTGADLYRTDLRGIVGLDSVLDLATARFHQTVVNERERSVILAAFRDGSLFDLHTD